MDFRKIWMLLSCVSLKGAEISCLQISLDTFITWNLGGGGATLVREYSLVSASPPRGQESGLISARHQTRLSLHTPRARGSPRLREETCQSHSDVRCDCNAFATDVDTPPPSLPPAHPEVQEGKLLQLWMRRASEAACAGCDFI